MAGKLIKDLTAASGGELATTSLLAGMAAAGTEARKFTIAQIGTILSLGTAAAATLGTSGATVPLLSTANTWTLSQTMSAALLGFDGTKAAPGHSFSAEPALGMFRRAAGIVSFTADVGKSSFEIVSSTYVNDEGLHVANGIGLGASATDFSTTGYTLGLKFDGAGILGLRNTTQAHALRTYYTYTDGSNHQRIALNTNVAYGELACETAGTGADDLDLRLTPAGTGMVDFRNAQDGAAAQVGTLTNAPTAGNPAKWMKVKIGGSTYHIPAWT